MACRPWAVIRFPGAVRTADSSIRSRLLQASARRPEDRRAVRNTVSCQCVAEITGWTAGPIWCTLPLRTPHSAPAFRLVGARHDAAAAFRPQPGAPAAGDRGRLPVTAMQSASTNTASQTFGIDGRAAAARPRRWDPVLQAGQRALPGAGREAGDFVTFDRAVTVKAQVVYSSSAGGLVPGSTVLLTSAAHGRSTVPGAASGRSCKPVRVACLNGTADVENTVECERGK